MDPFLRYKSESFWKLVSAMVFVPAFLIAVIKGIECSSFIKGIESFFIGILVVICINMFGFIPLIIGDIRKWLQIRNTPQFLYDKIIQSGDTKSLEKLGKLAKVDNIEAAYYLSLAYYEENSAVDMNPHESYNWAKYAAEKGDGWAQNLLARLYIEGYGIEKDYKKAVYWFEESLKRNIYSSEFDLYCCYEQGGYGLEQDSHKAFQHLKNYAQKTNDIASKFLVGIWLFDGYGVEEDKVEAFKWFKEVANTPNVETIYDSEIEMCVDWTQILPEEAVIKSYYNMAVCFQYGYGTPIDLEAAQYWKNKYEAAIQDHDTYINLDEKGRKKFCSNKINNYWDKY